MEIIIKPILTEKMTIQGEKLNRYGFIMPTVRHIRGHRKKKNGNTLSLLPPLLRCFFLRTMHLAKKKPQRCCKSPLCSWQTSPVSPMH